jgi:hypothetical protein
MTGCRTPRRWTSRAAGATSTRSNFFLGTNPFWICSSREDPVMDVLGDWPVAVKSTSFSPRSIRACSI